MTTATAHHVVTRPVVNMPGMYRTIRPVSKRVAVPGTNASIATYASKLRYLARRRGNTMMLVSSITIGDITVETERPTGGVIPRGVKDGQTVLLQMASWSLPAGQTCPGKVATTDTHICGHCLADGASAKITATGKRAVRGGNYGRTSTKRAQRLRYEWTIESLKSAEGRDAWVETMIAHVRRETRYLKQYRPHESGDLFAPRYVAMWRRVIEATPEVEYWISTRTHHGAVGGFGTVLGDAVRGLRSLPNVYLRESSLDMDAEPPATDPIYGTTVVTNHDHPWLSVNGGNVHLCPAHSNGNVCGPCGACFSPVRVGFQYH
jgi:hypothetical protein